MRRLVLAFGLILGCEDEAPPPPPPAPVVAKDTGEGDAEAAEEAPAKPDRTAAEAAHDLLVGGNADGALAAAAAVHPAVAPGGGRRTPSGRSRTP